MDYDFVVRDNQIVTVTTREAATRRVIAFMVAKAPFEWITDVLVEEARMLPVDELHLFDTDIRSALLASGAGRLSKDAAELDRFSRLCRIEKSIR